MEEIRKLTLPEMKSPVQSKTARANHQVLTKKPLPSVYRVFFRKKESNILTAVFSNNIFYTVGGNPAIYFFSNHYNRS